MAGDAPWTRDRVLPGWLRGLSFGRVLLFAHPESLAKSSLFIFSTKDEGTIALPPVLARTSAPISKMNVSKMPQPSRLSQVVGGRGKE